jgi:RNA polymerase sigma-70 factor (sigma-E family)
MTTGGHWAGNSREDQLLSRLYQQVTERQAARFGGGYDVAAGRDRYVAWLREHTAEDQADVPARGLRPLHADVAGIGQGTPAPGRGEVVTAIAAEGDPSGRHSADHRDADRAADSVVTTLYRAHYRSLVRLAALLAQDIATAEEIVQDSFVAVHAARAGLPDSDQALAYLRRTVVSRCRSARRRQPPPARSARPSQGQPSSGSSAATLLEHSAMVAALRGLPPRQREALVLRYYGDLSEAQVAVAMGISKGAVKTHTARAMSAIRAILEWDDDPVPLDPRHMAPADHNAPEWPDPDGHRYA